MKYLLLLLLIGCAGVKTPGAPDDGITPVDGTPYYYVAGTIQLDHNNNWELLQDENHDSINVDHIEVNPNDITVVYSQPAKTVITAGVNMDETFSQLGYWAGPSVGLGKLVINFGQLINGTVQSITTDQLKVGQGNFFFTAILRNN